MTLVIIINAFLALAVLIAIVGGHAWAIGSADRDAVMGTGLHKPETAIPGRRTQRRSYKDRHLAVIQP